MGDVTLVPAEFTLVKFDADEVRRLIRQTMDLVGFPADLDLTVEVDEVLPHPLTASVAEIVDGAARLWFTGGCFEDPRRQTGLSIENTRVELGAGLFRLMDRRDGGFESAPADEQLTDRQRGLWDAYAEARSAAVGLPVRETRRRYVYRLYCGFNDLADSEFDRLWGGATLTWDALAELADRLAEADTRPEAKKSLRRESLRQTAAS